MLKSGVPVYTVWFWQRIVTPHISELCRSLAARSCDIVYVANEVLSDERIKLGWRIPDLGAVKLEIRSTAEEVRAAALSAPADSIHICQGMRGHGLIGEAIRVLCGRRLRTWIIMETVEDRGISGFLRRLTYRRLIGRKYRDVEGVLAIGHRTGEWLVSCGFREERVYPFAYFLREPAEVRSAAAHHPVFRFMYVGQLVERKRVDLFINALSRIGSLEYELVVVGSGPLEQGLRKLAAKVLPGRVNWLGTVEMNGVSECVATADCLVLPSRFDGWGAVACEALMVGTPVICSDSCGAAGVVLASGRGGVFSSGDLGELTSHLRSAIEQGIVSPESRSTVRSWAECLGAEAGATYVLKILSQVDHQAANVRPPWSPFG